MPVPVRVIFYRERRNWAARCLEYNAFGQGRLAADAHYLLQIAMRDRRRELKSKRLTLDAVGVDEMYEALFDLGKPIRIPDLWVETHSRIARFSPRPTIFRVVPGQPIDRTGLSFS